jgi:hypothetical protein
MTKEQEIEPSQKVEDLGARGDEARRPHPAFEVVRADGFPQITEQRAVP